MGDSAKALLRSGAISPTQAGKHGLAKLKGTTVNRPSEEDFNGKQGLADQGRGKLKGHSVATKKHIDSPDQKPDFPKAFATKASKGAGVPDPRGAVKPGEINGSNQKPAFPKAGGSTKSSKGGDGVKAGQESVDEIDERDNQKPFYPKQGAFKKGSAKGASNARSKKKPAAQGGLYGGGGRTTQ
jgi:hypothetical protein